MTTSLYPKQYDVIVIGAGHAGCEAALAASTMGGEALLLTISLDSIAYMACNPSIGGLAKGHAVREIDALGGAMAQAIDATGIQFRMLNMSRGPAVRAPRAQADKLAYQRFFKHWLEKTPHLDILQQRVDDLILEDGGNNGAKRRIRGVITHMGLEIHSASVIIATGTFLNGLIHIGDISFPSGRLGEEASTHLAHRLRACGFDMGRLKTGTPPRINKHSIDFSRLEVQEIMPDPQPFSFSTTKISVEQIPCHITYTNKRIHTLVKDNLPRSPLYTGKITGTGARYCPSIEDKIVRFPDKDRHQVFIEPEGRDTEEMYINGVSTSLPHDVQQEIIHSLPGFESAHIMRYGYGIEYEFINPQQLKTTLETKAIEGLFLAGQINGTTGYEEAAAQGLMAGINAMSLARGREPLILGRSEAYIGVLIDDLVTKGTQEPYRLFTASAEYRLLLRQDNADTRLMSYGNAYGLVNDTVLIRMKEKQKQIEEAIQLLSKTRHEGQTLENLLKRPEMTIDDLPWEQGLPFPPDIAQAVEMDIKYQGYIQRDVTRARKMKALDKKLIPETLDYTHLTGLKKEAREKLQHIRPHSVGQACRIAGVSPSDIAVIAATIERQKKKGSPNK